LPAASFTVAVNVAVSATTMLFVDGVTVTLAAGTALTVTVAVTVLPSLVAVMTDVPAATAVTRPLADTVATAVVPETHVITRPVNTLPFASLTVGTSVVV
jgi:hypothetical protein